ncbi:unnamed protein product [marine sediment metagenome]|uniref:Uncharacterized protein n=1 Tax=marine sediment metagenome TaxID=412755 RepID=X0RUZ2_9ZZZZ
MNSSKYKSYKKIILNGSNITAVFSGRGKSKIFKGFTTMVSDIGGTFADVIELVNPKSKRSMEFVRTQIIPGDISTHIYKSKKGYDLTIFND